MQPSQGAQKHFQFLSISSISIFIVIILTFLESGTALQCDRVVKIESTEILSYLANVTFPAPLSSQGSWTLYMKTNAPFTFIGGWGVSVQVDEVSHAAATFHSAQEVKVEKGTPISFRFRLHFAHQDQQLPKVKSIQWEKSVVCEEAGSDTLPEDLPKPQPSSRTNGVKGQHSGAISNLIVLACNFLLDLMA